MRPSISSSAGTSRTLRSSSTATEEWSPPIARSPEDLFGLPAPFLRAVGAFLAVFAALVWLVGSREQLRPGAVLAVVVANVVWVVGSLALVALGVFGPSTAGAVWIAMQAGAVALFAALQVVARRRGAIASGPPHQEWRRGRPLLAAARYWTGATRQRRVTWQAAAVASSRLCHRTAWHLVTPV